MVPNGENLRMRKLDTGDSHQYNDLLRYAFQVTEKVLMEYGWDNDDIRQSKRPVLERAQVLGFFDEDRLVSQFASYPLKMNVHGVPYNIGFITSVATYPEYGGMGLMSQLMDECLRQMREAGQSLSLLFPYSIPLYRHKGWELISDRMSFRVKDGQLPRGMEAPGYIRRVAEDSEDMRSLYTRFAWKTHGCIFRNDLAWDEYWRWDVEDTEIAIYYSVDGEPMGYVVYLLKEEIMHIKELLPMNNEAWQGLWKYIAAHESMVDEVVGAHYDNEPIAFWLEDSAIKESIRPYMMGRIVDVEHFLQHYAFLPGEAGAVTLYVEDALLEWNRRPVTVRFGEGGHEVLPGEETGMAIRCTIGELTTMLLSYKRPLELWARERITGEEEAVALLDRVIPPEKAHISDYI